MSRSFAGTALTTRPSIESVPEEIDFSPAIIRKRRGLAAAGRAEQHHELAVADIETDRVGRGRVAAVVDLRQPVERYDSHDVAHFTAPAVMPWISFSEKNA